MIRHAAGIAAALACLAPGALPHAAGAVRRDNPAAAPAPPARVLVVMNARSADSVAIGQAYASRRQVPEANRCTIACTSEEDVTAQEYADSIEKPVRAFIERGRRAIDYIVLTRGIPIRLQSGPDRGLSTDGLLATMELDGLRPRARNPYYGRSERFSHARFGYYLVSRLDGYTRADCLRLIDHALAAAPAKGPFLLHAGPGHTDPGYRFVNEGMQRAHALLRARGLTSLLSTTDVFPGYMGLLMGYFSWGSNDPKFNRDAYRAARFAPGAIAETAVSTSARTFRDPDARGQSLIADLIAQGVTGCKGYVSEPYVDAIAAADILFDRYAAGYGLAESFYMASRYLRWKDVVIGDPLCAPYGPPRPPSPPGSASSTRKETR